MSKTLGNLSFEVDANNEYSSVRPYSQWTQEIIDAEANGLVSTAFYRAVDLLKANRTRLDCLVNALMTEETLETERLLQLLGPRASETA
ncbi:unnamed protein product [Protopolystoma xenopodis]|uniref:Peptidase M41 domain-containing protein n=1 Tax=Protopolystoma xenopodis TaxID=117903 RepID=A0A3S4ZFM1_9PLAT|nr:unnamed protein product [Protopolystoma xenopodis]